MYIKTSNNKKTVVINKYEWLNIGQKQGWLNKEAEYINNCDNIRGVLSILNNVKSSLESEISLFTSKGYYDTNLFNECIVKFTDAQRCYHWL